MTNLIKRNYVIAAQSNCHKKLDQSHTIECSDEFDWGRSSLISMTDFYLKMDRFKDWFNLVELLVGLTEQVHAYPDINHPRAVCLGGSVNGGGAGLW